MTPTPPPWPTPTPLPVTIQTPVFDLDQDLGYQMAEYVVQGYAKVESWQGFEMASIILIFFIALGGLYSIVKHLQKVQ